jgi:hypothetical protein
VANRSAHREGSPQIQFAIARAISADLCSRETPRPMDVTQEERNVLLAALFELWLTRSAFDDDPGADQVPIARISKESIESLIAKLGGDLDTALFGAFRDEWVDVNAPVPNYPADETDER